MRSKKFYALLALSGAFGALTALLTVAFFFALKVGIQFMWEVVPSLIGIHEATSSPIYIIVICSIGGLVVGLITWYTKVKPMLLMEEFEEFTTSGRMRPRNGIVGMIRGLIGLIFGGSIGPEGPLTGGSGAVGTWLAERRKFPRPVVAIATYASISGMFGSFLSSPFGMAILTIEGGLEKGKLSWKLLFPGIVASAVGYTVFFIITGYVFGGMYVFPPYDGLHAIHLLYALLLGLLGGGIGLLFIFLFRGMRRGAEKWHSRPVELAVLAGVILGLVGAVLPLTLFSGDAEIQTIIDEASSLGIIMLLVLGLAKVFLTVSCLSLGWSGGYIFPSFFAGAAIGLAVHLMFPFIPEVVCLTCTISGLSVALLRSPIALTFIVGALFDPRLAPVMAISVIAAFLLTYKFDLIQHGGAIEE